MQIWVYANNFEYFLVAVVVPQRKAHEDWAVKHNSTNDFKSLFQNPKATKYILDDLKKSFTFLALFSLLFCTQQGLKSTMSNNKRLLKS